MKKRNYFITFILTFILFSNTIYAECTTEDYKNFNDLRDRFTVTYKLNDISKKYHLYFTNPSSGKFTYTLIAAEGADKIIYINSEFEEVEYIPDKAGKYIINIKGNTDTCKDTFKTMNIDVPSYNIYSEDELCKGNEEFVLCQPTYSKDIDYDTFVSRLEVYKATKVRKEEEEKENNSISKKLGNLWNYIVNNIIVIIVIIIFIVAIVVSTILIVKSMRKSRRLE